MLRSIKAFTLIELLVVMGVIAILAALSFPVYSSVRAKADRVTCASNLRQIVIATQLCANENNGMYPAMKGYDWDSDGYMDEPSATPWYQDPTASPMGIVLAPYLGISAVNTVNVSPTKIPAIFKCPAVAKNQVESQLNPWINNYPTYRYNGYAAGRGAATVRSAPNAMLFIDSVWPGSTWPQTALAHQHAAGINVAYLDGHVDFMSYSQYKVLNPTTDYQGALYLNGWFQ